MEFTNPVLIPIMILVLFLTLLFIFLLLVVLSQKTKIKKLYKENFYKEEPYGVMLYFLAMVFIPVFVSFLVFLLDFHLSGPVKEMKTNSFAITGRDETVTVTVKDKQFENQTFVFDDSFYLITDNKNVSGQLKTNFEKDTPLTYYKFKEFKQKILNPKKKNKFKLIYKEKKYIVENLFQTLIRTLSGQKVNQSKIRTSIIIELTENSDFNYEQ